MLVFPFALNRITAKALGYRVFPIQTFEYIVSTLHQLYHYLSLYFIPYSISQPHLNTILQRNKIFLSTNITHQP